MTSFTNVVSLLESEVNISLVLVLLSAARLIVADSRLYSDSICYANVSYFRIDSVDSSE